MPRVLIADDDELIRKLLRTIAERNGCDTATAANGEEALHLLRRQRFDLIVLDLMMTVLNGYEVIPYIREIKPRPVVLVMTAMIGDGSTDLDSEVVTAIVHKPFDAEVLGSLIAQVAGSMSDSRRASNAAELRPRPEAR
jgi:CheY-like chemotaxis protein